VLVGAHQERARIAELTLCWPGVAQSGRRSCRISNNTTTEGLTSKTNCENTPATGEKKRRGSRAVSRKNLYYFATVRQQYDQTFRRFGTDGKRFGRETYLFHHADKKGKKIRGSVKLNVAGAPNFRRKKNSPSKGTARLRESVSPDTAPSRLGLCSEGGARRRGRSRKRGGKRERRRTRHGVEGERADKIMQEATMPYQGTSGTKVTRTAAYRSMVPKKRSWYGYHAGKSDGVIAREGRDQESQGHADVPSPHG